MSLSKRFRNLAAAFLMALSTVAPMGGALVRSAYAEVGDDAPANSKRLIDNGDGTYSPNTTPIILDQNFIATYYSTVSSNFIEDGSYIRLSYVSLGYDFTSLLKRGCPIKHLSLNCTGRNLFLLTKYTGNEPAILASTSGGTGGMGIDNYNIPSTRSFNFTLKASF